MGYSFHLAARGLLYHIPRHGALNGTRNNSMGPPSGIDPTAYRTMKSADIRGMGRKAHSNRPQCYAPIAT